MLRLTLLALSLPAALAATPPRPMTDAPAPVIEAKSRSTIDKSCLMICKRWGEHDCLEWKMVCKGDADYPRGVLLDRMN